MVKAVRGQHGRRPSDSDVEMQADPMVGDILREKHRIAKAAGSYHAVIESNVKKEFGQGLLDIEALPALFCNQKQPKPSLNHFRILN